MFHLLVKFEQWSKSRDSLRLERVFEYTEQSIADKFKPNEKLATKRIVTVPALFVNETDGRGPQYARVGTINKAKISGNEVELDYTFDQSIPPISNSMLRDLANQLKIESFEFIRTHWAMKDVDLFFVLLKNQISLLPSPKVFKLDDHEGMDQKLVSFMMPFNTRFNKIHATMKESINELKMQSLRADDIWVHDAVIQDIVSLIYKSRVVVCDCTGRNANVFYEAGIAHSLGRDVILITQNKKDVPFDLRHLRFIHYSNTLVGRKKLSDELQRRIRTLLK